MLLRSTRVAALLGVAFAIFSLCNAKYASHAYHHASSNAVVPGQPLPRGRCRGGPLTDRDYIVISNFPDPDDDTELQVAARSRVRFTEVFENLYTATGFGNSTLADMSVNVPVDLLAIFNPTTCLLSGSGYSFDVRVNDVFTLTVFSPEQMSGPYASLINDAVVFTRFGRFDFTLEE